SPANASAVHARFCSGMLAQWHQTRGKSCGCRRNGHRCCMAAPWRWTKGAAPCAVQAARTVLNGGDEETYRKATRLVPTQPGYSPRLRPSVGLPLSTSCIEGGLSRAESLSYDGS